VKVLWTRLALADLDHAYEYVAADNPDAAEQLLDRIQTAAQILARHSAAGRSGRISGTRELIVVGTPFVIAYRIRGKTAELLAVIHGSRRWPDEL
jgi:toxin ParE1/3/4